YYESPYTTGTVIQGNSVTGNDIGVWLSNLDAGGNAPASPTNIKVVNNTISCDRLNNTTGLGSAPYQAGISDVGNKDKLINNKISGAGYNPDTKQGSTFYIDADASFTNRAKVKANKFE
ncbi:MAG TPA: hypothetical protein VHS28_02800, partial [Chloroflexota bacterium]|nr:hypothetical protein [Chloroflexota bacterium]